MLAFTRMVNHLKGLPLTVVSLFVFSIQFLLHELFSDNICRCQDLNHGLRKSEATTFTTRPQQTLCSVAMVECCNSKDLCICLRTTFFRKSFDGIKAGIASMICSFEAWLEKHSKYSSTSSPSKPLLDSGQSHKRSKFWNYDFRVVVNAIFQSVSCWELS